MLALICVGMIHDQQPAARDTAAEEENVLVKSLQDVLKDKSFEIRTPVTIQTRQSAVGLLEWCLRDANKWIVKAFVKQLTATTNGISSSVKKSFSYNKENMWKKFYLLRIS